MYIAFLRSFQGPGDLNDHRILNVIRSLRVLRVLNFLDAPGFLYKRNGKACKAEM